MSEAPAWKAPDEAMFWLNELEKMQGGANGPTIKLRAALLAMGEQVSATVEFFGGTHSHKEIEKVAAHLALELAEQRAENFALAAGQCANVAGDEGGTPQCKRIAELSAGLADACELLQGWIAAKCPARYRSEHLAHVEKLRGLLGPNVEVTCPQGRKGL